MPDDVPAGLVVRPLVPRSRASELTAVRAWARSRGVLVDEGGSVPLSVLRTYRRLHPLAA